MGINLAAPKVADITGIFGNWSANACTIQSSGSNITNSKKGTFILTQNTCRPESDEEYELTNYGVPDTQHGSGTR